MAPIASRFNDDGVTALYQGILPRSFEHGLKIRPGTLSPADQCARLLREKRDRPAGAQPLPCRGRGHGARLPRPRRGAIGIARERQQLLASKSMLSAAGKDAVVLDPLIEEKNARLDAGSRQLIEAWPETKRPTRATSKVVKVREREIRTRLNTISLSGTRVPKVALPGFEDHGEILKWRLRENLPGFFPFTAGVFSFKRENEDPTRMFAGEGDPFRTNRRFHLLSKDLRRNASRPRSIRLTLYGFDPDPRRTSTARSEIRACPSPRSKT